MATVSFFTNEASMSANQSSTECFGPIADLDNNERYNLENRFEVVTGAPVFAITKGLLIAVANTQNAELLNLILLPINNTTAGFPARFFVYRGIQKNSLITSTGSIPLADNSWASNNILSIIKGLQDKKNTEEGTPGVIATSDSLGFHLSTLPDQTFMESLFFNNNVDFQPLIVEAGCQIGKYLGGGNTAGIQIILNKVGNEPTLQVIKQTSHIFSIPKVNLNDPSLTSKQQMELSFKNRYQKEFILNYVDLAAFYGVCKNQGITVVGMSDSGFNRFYNKNTIYIDIRDDYGFSFNHFFKFQDSIWTAINPSGNSPNHTEYIETDYYSNWPILQIRNIQFTGITSHLWIKLPLYKIKSESPSYCGCLTADFFSSSNIRDTPFQIIANDPQSASTVALVSNPLRFNCWKQSDGKAGANYFLMRVSYPYDPSTEDTNKVWYNFFNLDMKNIFDTLTFVQGEFASKCYSALSAPLIKDTEAGAVYTSVIGLAVDKEHFTFFSYKEEKVYGQSDLDDYLPVPLLSTGIYRYNYNPNDYEISNISTPNIGFVAMLCDGVLEKNYTLSNFTVQDSDLVNLQVLSYAKAGDFQAIDDVFESIELISLKKDEYNTLKAVTSISFPDHPTFIKSVNYKEIKNMNYNVVQTDISVGLPVIVEDSETGILYVDLVASPNPVLLNGNPITFSSINYK